MKEVLRIYWFLLFLFLVTSLAHGQVRRDSAARIRFGTAVPATCNPDIGQVFFLISPGTPLGMQQCLATDTWTPMVGTMSGTGSANEVAFFTAPTDLAGDAGFRFSGGDVLIGSPTTISFEADGTAALLNLNMNADAAVIAFGANQDGQIHWDEADALSQRRGLNPQEWRLYDRFVSLSDYDRLAIYVGGGPPVKTFEISAETTDAGTGGIDLQLEAVPGLSGGVLRLITGTSQVFLSQVNFSAIPGDTVSITNFDNFEGGGVMQLGLAETVPQVGIDLRIASIQPGTGQRDSHSINMAGRGDDGNPFETEWKMQVEMDADSNGDSSFVWSEQVNSAGFDSVMKVTNTINNPGQFQLLKRGPHAFGLAIDFQHQFTFGNDYFPVLGADLTGVKFRLEQNVIGAAGMTTSLYGMDLDIGVNTQAAAESIADIATLNVEEPGINDLLTGGGLITQASTLRIGGAPTEGVANFAILVETGLSQFRAIDVVGDIDLSGGMTFTNNNGLFWRNAGNTLDIFILALNASDDTILNAPVTSDIRLQVNTSDVVTLSSTRHSVLTAGPHSRGGAGNVSFQFLQTGSFTAGAAGGSEGAGHRFSSTFTGASGKTTGLHLMDINGAIITQTATQSIANIATLNLEEPSITDNLTGSITQAQTLRIGGAPTEGVANYALNVEDGSVRIGGAGPHAIAGTPSGIIQLIISDTFTSDGSGTQAAGLFHTPTIVGAAGDTTSLIGTFLTAAITTQTATESIADIAQLQVNEPFITDNLTGSITQASTVLITGAPTEGTRNYALNVEDGSVRFASTGPHVIGGVPQNFVGFTTVGNFTSGGVSVQAYGVRHAMNLLGANGDTVRLAGMDLAGTITTQTATESITDVAQLSITEPVITDNLTGSITNASTLLVIGAPTEGTNNFAVRVTSGLSQFGGTVQTLDTQGPAFVDEVGSVTNPTVIPNRTFFDSGFAVTDDEGSQRISAIAEGTELLRLTLTNATMTLTGAFSLQGAQAIFGNSDTQQLRLRGNSTQTNLVLNVETSASSALFTVANNGDTLIAGALNHDGSNVGFFGVAPAVQPAAYTRNATIVEDRTLLASASATALNNNNVLAALIADLQSLGIIQ